MTRIFVEGKEDKEFLEEYLSFLKYDNSHYKVIPCNGNKITENHLSFIKEAKDPEQKVALIFDADRDYSKTLQELLQQSIQEEDGRLLQESEIFLFPNNCENGELETLLFEILKYPEIYQCFECYRECISSHRLEYGNNIAKKSARYAYFEALGLSESKNRKNKYQELFDFQSDRLKPLKNFLQSAFKS